MIQMISRLDGSEKLLIKSLKKPREQPLIFMQWSKQYVTIL